MKIPKSFKKINTKTFRFISIFAIVFLLIFYVFQVNAMVGETALIENFELESNNLSEENRDLEVAFSQKNSLKHLEGNLEELGFEKVVQIDYIQVLETSMAAK